MKSRPPMAPRLLVVPVLMAASPLVSAGPGLTTRPAICAGTWYPGEAEDLSRLLDKLLAEAPPPKLEGRPIAIIAPHAGYHYSALVAAAAYHSLRNEDTAFPTVNSPAGSPCYKRVIVLAFSHRYAGSYQGVDIPAELSAYETPLGPVPIDREVVEKLLGNAPFVSTPGLHRQEHSLELQLPFLQRTLKDWKLVPLLVGQMTPRDYAAAAVGLSQFIDEKTLIVASSDFTHFGPNYRYQPFKDNVEPNLRELAEKAAAPLQKCDFDGFVEHLDQTGDTICGRGPICLLLRLLSMRGGAEAVRTALDTSGRQTHDWTNSVTYQSFVFTARKPGLDEATSFALLQLARQTVTAYIRGQSPPKAEDLPDAAHQIGACFVTLQNHGELRGCIGNMEARGPLWEAVLQNAVNACQDPRFTSNPVTLGELPQIDIEISRLTPMKPIASPQEVIIGRHGLFVELGGWRGVLLPQVAYERGWTRPEFLAQVCRKAGLPADAWRKPEAKLYTFEAEVFGERELVAKVEAAVSRPAAAETRPVSR